MDTHRLVAMANDIAAFFASEPDGNAAADGVRNHLQKFWAPRMRAELIAHAAAGGEGLSDLAREAVKQLPPPAAGA